MAEKLYKVNAVEHRVFEETILGTSRGDAQETFEIHIRHGFVKPKKATLVYDRVVPYIRYLVSTDVKYSSGYAVVDRMNDKVVAEFVERQHAVKFRDLLNEEETQ